MRTNVFSLIIAAFTVSAGIALPASALPCDTLSLSECIRAAEKYNIGLQKATLDYQSAAIDQSAARSAFLPEVNARIGQGFDFGRSQDNTGVYIDRSSANTSFGVNAGVTVFKGLSRLHNLKSAKIGQEAAKLKLQRAANDLALQVASYYYTALFQASLVEVARMQLLLGKEQLDRTKAMVESGKWSKNKQFEIDARLANEELQLQRAENDLALSLLELRQCMNADYTVIPASPGIDLLVDGANARINSTEQIYAIALSHLPQIKASQLAVEQGKYGVAAAKAGYYPSLSLSLGYGNSYYYLTGERYKRMNAPFGEQWRQNGRSYINLDLSIPLFDAFHTRTQVQRSRLNLIALRLAARDEEQRLYKEIDQATLNARASLKQISSALHAREAARAAYEAADIGYRAGRIGSYEYGDAKNKLMQAEIDELKAKYDFVYRVCILDFYQGKDNFPE